MDKTLENQLDIEILMQNSQWRSRFNATQLDQIKQGINQGINAKLYANPKYNHMQMAIIANALANNINLRSHISPIYNWLQLNEIIHGLSAGVDVNLYKNPQFSQKQMELIRIALENHLDPTPLLSNKLNLDDLTNLRLELLEKIPKASITKKNSRY